METFKITVDARGDSIDPADWCKEIKELLEKHYFVVEVEHLEDGKDKQ